jgi:hypothetical protein
MFAGEENMGNYTLRSSGSCEALQPGGWQGFKCVMSDIRSTCQNQWKYVVRGVEVLKARGLALSMAGNG